MQPLHRNSGRAPAFSDSMMIRQAVRVLLLLPCIVALHHPRNDVFSLRLGKPPSAFQSGMLRRAGTRRPLHAGLRGGGDADDIVHVNLSTPASPPDNSPVLSEANDADSEPENLHAPPITRATSYLTRVLSVVMDNSNASEWNSSLPQTVDPVTVQHLLEEEIREMAVESLGTHVSRPLVCRHLHI
eukprot:685559-Rhodomonas_salina.5